MDIAGKRVIITGGGRGLGKKFAETLKAYGAEPFVLGLTKGNMDALWEESGIRGAVVDVSDEGQVEGFFARYVSENGCPDVVVNNAGITADHLFIKKKGEEVSKFPLANWEKVIGVNLTGVFLCAREAAFHMVKCGVRGVIVNISSISRAGNLGQTNYSASKSAVDALTVTWAKELSRFGIRVAAVAPGYVNTDMVASVRPDVLEKVIASIPVGRLGETREIADAVHFIVKNEFYNGRVMEIDGGMRL